MGIQINGQTDTISAVDGALTVSGADLPTVTNLNATGVVTAGNFRATSNIGISSTNPRGLLDIVDSSIWSNGFRDVFNAEAPNQGSGGGLSLNFGKNRSTNNLGKIVYNHSSDGGTDNSVGLGFYNNDNLFRVFASGNSVVSGNLGIGSTSPSSLLHLLQSSGNAKITIQRSNTASNTDDYGSILWRSSAANNNGAIGVARESAENDGYMYFSTGSGGTLSERVRIDSLGRLLIGGTASRQIDTVWGYYDSKLQSEGVASGAPSGISIIHNSSGGYPAYLALGASKATSLGGNTIVTNGMALGRISFQGSDGSKLVEAASIDCGCDGTPGTNDMPGNLTFSTTPDSQSSPTERLRISSTGQVYIGSSPNSDARLQVMVASPVSYNAAGYNGTNANIRLTTAGSPTTGNCTGISFGIGGSAEAYIGAVQVATTGYADLVFQGYGGSYSEKMRLTSTGRLLIGTSTDYTYGLLTVQGGNAGDAGNANGLYVRGNGAAVSCPIYFNDEFGYPQKSIYQESYYLKIRGHNNEGVWILGSNASTNPSTNYKFNGTNNGSQCFNASNTTTWNTTSDVRIKENIQTLENALEKINQIRPVSFDYTDEYAEHRSWNVCDEDDEKIGINDCLKCHNVGYIAQEYKEVFPNDVTVGPEDVGETHYEDFHQLQPNSVVPYLVKAVQELSAQNVALQARLDAAGL